jgi:DNA-binding transcriptional MerR regulator
MAQRPSRRVSQPALDGLGVPASGSDAAGDAPVDPGFRGPQVCSIVGITYRQLDYWARTDLVRPSIAEAKGSGTQRAYSYRDLVRLKVVKSLLDAGVKLETARKAIGYLREDLGDDWATANLVLDGNGSVLVRTDNALIDAVRKGQGVLNIVPLGHVMDELNADVAEYRSGGVPIARATRSSGAPRERRAAGDGG